MIHLRMEVLSGNVRLGYDRESMRFPAPFRPFSSGIRVGVRPGFCLFRGDRAGGRYVDILRVSMTTDEESERKEWCCL